MRQATNKYANLDMSKPLDNIESVDCFGSEFDARDHECSICGSANACAMMFRKNVNNPKVKSLDKEHNFVDKINFEAINKKQLFQSLITQETEEEELIEYVKSESKCYSTELVMYWLKLFYDEYKLYVEGGIVWKE